MQINDPAVVAEVMSLHERYETALVSNNIDALVEFFWDSEQALRFGVAESLYGAGEIEAFRKARSANNLEREIFNLRVVTFGDAHVTVTLEFRRVAFGIPRHGRQSQVWVRFPEGCADCKRACFAYACRVCRYGIGAYRSAYSGRVA